MAGRCGNVRAHREDDDEREAMDVASSMIVVEPCGETREGLAEAINET